MLPRPAPRSKSLRPSPNSEAENTVDIATTSSRPIGCAQKPARRHPPHPKINRPAVIAEDKVDCITGNPPWLTYGQSADIIREELRGMSEK